MLLEMLQRKHKSCPVLVNVGVSGYTLSFSSLISYLQFLQHPSILLCTVLPTFIRPHTPSRSPFLSLCSERELVVLAVANSSHLAD